MFVLLVSSSNLLFIIVLNTFSESEALLRCSQVLKQSRTNFDLTHTCSVSYSTVLASSRISSFEECQRFALKHYGLALNYASIDESEYKDQDNCIVYDCPELNPSYLDIGIYDYYSLYTEIDPELNTTCIPKLGLYLLVDQPTNYSEAESSCVWAGGQLARVTSADLTNHLSALVNTLSQSKKLILAYIGMNDIEREGSFVTVADEPLDCFNYRGWTPGQPKSQQITEDCVVLDSLRGWRVVDCKRKLPYICEIKANKENTCDHIINKKFRQICLSNVASARSRKRKRYQRCPKNENIDESKASR